jgi:hypothetical protein
MCLSYDECLFLNVFCMFLNAMLVHVCFPLQELDRFLYLYSFLSVLALRLVQGVHTRVIEKLYEASARSALELCFEFKEESVRWAHQNKRSAPQAKYFKCQSSGGRA